MSTLYSESNYLSPAAVSVLCIIVIVFFAIFPVTTKFSSPSSKAILLKVSTIESFYCSTWLSIPFRVNAGVSQKTHRPYEVSSPSHLQAYFLLLVFFCSSHLLQLSSLLVFSENVTMPGPIPGPFALFPLTGLLFPKIFV